MEFTTKLYFTACLYFITINVIFSADTCYLIPQVGFPDGRKTNKRLNGLAIVNTTAEAPLKCFTKCAEHCQCKSINVCGKDCQLNSGNQADVALSDSSDCTYFELSWAQCNSNRGSKGACPEQVRCCDHGNPCQNEGKCIEQCPSSGKRYRCVCPPFVSGENCQHAPKSCRALYDLDSSLPSGKYTMYDATGSGFKAYCDFTIDAGKVWTLVMSYAFGNNQHYIRTPLLYDNPRSEDEPNWEDYRLSKAHMAGVESDTTEWRITCNYNTQSISDRVDQVRVKNTAVNMLSYDAETIPVLSERCIQAEYLNIRGTSCSSCTVALIQTSVWMIFTNPSRNKVGGCDWQYPNGHGECEENFGGYECHNPEFRCTSSSSATTQMWYGS